MHEITIHSHHIHVEYKFEQRIEVKKDFHILSQIEMESLRSLVFYFVFFRIPCLVSIVKTGNGFSVQLMKT